MGELEFQICSVYDTAELAHEDISATSKPYAYAQKKDKYRRKGKGRRFCVGGRIYLIPSCDDFENRMNSSFYFKSSWCNSSYNSNRLVQNSQRGQELNQFCPPNRSDDICLFFGIYPSFMQRGYKLPLHCPFKRLTVRAFLTLRMSQRNLVPTVKRFLAFFFSTLLS